MPTMLRLALSALANADIVQRIEDRMARYGRAAGLALAAFFLALIAIAFLFQTLAAWLTLRVGPIWAPLIVAGVLFVLCAILALVAYMTLHGKSKPKHQTEAAALPGRALAALPDLAPLMRTRLPEIVAVAVVTGLLLGRHKRRR
jgi:fatty acid desaturase